MNMGEANRERRRVTLGKVSSAIMNGEEDVSLWSDEELRRGQRRDKNGKWRGRPPKVIPKAIHDEMARRLYDEAAKVIQDSLVDAVTLWAEIVRDPDADLSIRMKASENIVDRVLGKPRQAVTVGLTQRVQPEVWERVRATAIVADDGDEVIDVPALEAGEDE